MAQESITTEQVAQKLSEMKLSLDPQIAYRYETLFAKLEGWGAAGYVRRKHQLIRNVEPLLRKMLKPNEEVLYIGKGVQQQFVEQWFMGALIANLVNQTVFVLTNLRLIMIHSNTKGIPGHTYWEIFYSQIDKFKGSWTGSVELKLKDRKAFTFSGFEKLDRKQMPLIFEQALADYRELGFTPVVSQSRENLCSHCYEVIPKQQYQCGRCQAEYYKPFDIAWRSLIFPSWGDFLMGHVSAAIFELFTYLISWGIVLVVWINAIEEGEPGQFIAAAIMTVLLIGFEHLVDAALTYYIAGKGLHPKRKPSL